MATQSPFVAVNWTIDGVDATLDLLMSDGKWYPTEVGEHEIRANADGVFAAVRINVVTGSENTLATDAGECDDDHSWRVSSDLYVEIVDVHGNVAPAEEIRLSLWSPDSFQSNHLPQDVAIGNSMA